MTTCRDIITYALRQARVIGMSASPTASEADMGMAALQSMYDQMVTGGMFGTLEDIYLEEDETALEGKRYFIPTGITLTAATSDYVDEAGTSRLPRDLAVYETVTEAGVRDVLLYDRTGWVSLVGLALASEAPLSSRGALGLSACLAQTYCEAFGAELPPHTQMLARQFKGAISAKRGTTQDKIAAEYF